jgi:hypothetical protein
MVNTYRHVGLSHRREQRSEYKIFVGELEGRRLIQTSGVDERIILKCKFERYLRYELYGTCS